MASVQANGITLEYDETGDTGAPVILLVMGLGAQMILWPDTLRKTLADKGYRVIRFDNRDCGLSTKFESAGIPNMIELFGAFMQGEEVKSPYKLTDMADDAVALLDALKIDKAHIVGASMGGMIVQLMAANHASRVLSLTSIMSTTGNPDLPPAEPQAAEALLAPAPDPSDMEAAIQRGMDTWRAIGSKAYPRDEAELRAWVRAQVERAFYPQGVARQFAAIIADGDRRKRLAVITAPSVVIHGSADPLVPVAGGKDTAEHIKGADLRIIEGMGHDLPETLIPKIAEGILSAVARA